MPSLPYLAALLVLAACGRAPHAIARQETAAGAMPLGRREVMVCAAASLRAPFERLARAYGELHPGGTVHLEVAGSPTLVHRIEQGGALRRAGHGEPPDHGPRSGGGAPRAGAAAALHHLGDDGQGQSPYITLSAQLLVVWRNDGTVRGRKDLNTFPPLRGAVSITSGEIDPAAPGLELVAGTAGGRVVWLKFSELVNDYTKVLPLTRRYWADPGTGEVFEDRCNMSLAATWAMSERDGTTPYLDVVDRNGTWWKVDRITGHPVIAGPDGPVETGIEELRSLVWAGTGSIPGVFVEGADYRARSLLHLTSTMALLRLAPYVPRPTPSNPGAWDLLNPVSTTGPWEAALWLNGHWLCPKGGAARTVGSTQHTAWWSLGDTYANLLSGIQLTLSGTIKVSDAWNSTGPLAGNVRPSKNGPFRGLRTEMKNAAIMNLQSVRIGFVDPTLTRPQIVCSALGGRVMVLDGDSGALLAESDDLGFAGCALAVGNLDQDAPEEIAFLPAVDNIDASGQPMGASVCVLEYDTAPPPPGSPHRLVVRSRRALGSPTAEVKGYGGCGLAIADIDHLSPGNEVLATTLNGELLVLPCQDGLLGAPLYQRVFEGSIGAFSSIVLKYGAVPGEVERIYMAGSAGIRCLQVHEVN